MTAPQAVRYALIDPAYGGIYFFVSIIPAPTAVGAGYSDKKNTPRGVVPRGVSEVRWKFRRCDGVSRFTSRRK